MSSSSHDRPNMSAMVFRIDPHAHTRHSDGTDTAWGLVRAAKDAGLSVVGITDHDTIAGWAEAAAASEELGVGVLRGAEFSAAHEGNSVHVLGYLMNADDDDLAAILARAESSRLERLEQMAANLQADYPRLQWQNVVHAAAGAPLGRPHLADELVSAGYFVDRAAAFQWALSPQGPYFVPQNMPTPVEVVRVIRKSGGVPVLAHPRSTTRGWVVPDDLVAEMAEAGLYGIERDHRDHDPEGRRHVQRLATRLGLRVTGGSDYHGTGKPNKLGENLLDPYILREIAAQGRTEFIGVRAVHR